jgi:hypothetical protein
VLRCDDANLAAARGRGTYLRVLVLTDCAMTVVVLRAFVVSVHVPFDRRILQV